MIRKIEKTLVKWKESRFRKPLVLRGARQVGKTWLLKEFGRTHFKHVAYFSFDREDAPRMAFETKNPKRIVEELELIAGHKFIPGETLLVLDEIQEFPPALGALKYFCEDMPELHVAAAGSLLGTILAKPMSYPVGKVNLVDVRPMDFAEFLEASDAEAFRIFNWIKPGETIDATFHLKLLDAYHRYLLVGGMPECVDAWCRNRDLQVVERIQDELLAFYEGDFGKHLEGIDATRVLLTFRSVIPQLAKQNEKFLYGAIKEGARAREFETAVEWCVQAGLFNRLYNVAKAECPHKAFERLDCYKIFLFDTGLARRMARVPTAALLSKSDYQFKGPFVENYVLQQLSVFMDVPPHYFSVKDSHEIDFILQVDDKTVPVEVKGGEAVKSPSLKSYVKKHKPDLALRLSEKNFHREGPLMSVPLYFVPRLKELFTIEKEPSCSKVSVERNRRTPH